MIQNFLINNVNSEDLIDVIFDPEEGLDEVIISSNNLLLEDMAVIAGIFPSKGQARKNGFSGEAPFGLWCLGTKKRWFWVWNPKRNDVEAPKQFIRG